MNDEARTWNDEGMTNETCVPGVIRYIVTSGLRFNDSTLQRFNVAKPFVIRVPRRSPAKAGHS
jgi:hypothetical protein